MNVNIIIPFSLSKRLKEDIIQKKDENDEITFVDVRKDTGNYKRILDNSHHKYNIIVHPVFNLSNENWISKIKSHLETINESTVIIYSNTNKSEHKNFIDIKNSLICFNKDQIEIKKKLYKNPIIYMRYIASCFESKKYLYPDSLDLEGNEEKKDKSKPVKENKKPSKKTREPVRSKENTKSPGIRSKEDKPKILFITDVKGWAWWIKSEYLKKYLSDEFNIDIVSIIDEKKQIDKNKYDLYFTYGHGFVRNIQKVPFNRRITGITAHRPLNAIKGNIRRAYATHANSILLLNELKTIHSNCYYLPNGVDTNKFYPQKESNILERDHINIGHVGKLSPQKGQKKIIEPVIEKLKKRGNKVNYISHYNNYQNRISHNKMPNLYQDMDLFIVASHEDATPNPFLEASACGVPTVGNRIGNLPEFITQGVNGYVVENLTIDNYVKIIESLNKEHLIEMGKNARQTAIDEWTWEIQAENYRYMLKNILGME